MKILQVIPYYAPAWSFGGTVRVAYEISTGLAKKGHEVTVYTSDFLNSQSRVITPKENKCEIVDGVKVHYFKNLSLLFYRLTRLSITPSLILFARRDLIKYDVIHLHQYRSLQNVIILYFANRRGIPCVLHPHGSIGRIVEKRTLKYLFDAVFGYHILYSMKKVFALTNSEAQECSSLGVSSSIIQVIPNGVDLLELNVKSRNGSFKEKYGIRNSEKMVLYLGRLHKSKGLDLLIDSFYKLSIGMSDVVLTLIGPDDGYKVEIEKRIESYNLNSRVKILGYISEADKYAALSDADVFVTPSFYGFPVTFIESLACGTPIITSKHGDYIDEIDGVAGIFTDYSSTCFEIAMRKILTDTKLRNRLGESGRLLVKEHYNWDKITEQLVDVYSSLIADIRRVEG